MAKRKGENKSEAVRSYLKVNPNASTHEIAEALGQQGIKVSAALIYNVRANRNKRSGRAKRSRSTKGSAHGGKAEAIRQEVAKQGDSARNRDVIAALRAKGMEVTAAHVANVRARMDSGGGKGAGRRGSTVSAGSTKLSLAQLLAAKQMAQRLGGIDSARRMLDALAKLR